MGLLFGKRLATIFLRHRIRRPHIIGLVADLSFPTLENGVDESRIQKLLLFADSKISGDSRTWFYILKSLDNSDASNIDRHSAIGGFGGKRGDWKGLIFF